jgi:tetratricopeptide (TPR) repeat protein
MNQIENSSKVLEALVSLKKDRLDQLVEGVNWETLSKNIPNDHLGAAFYNLGKTYYDKADLLKAEKCFRSALDLAEVPRDFFTRFKILGFLVRIASENQNAITAEQAIAESEMLMETVSRELGTLNAEFFYNQGIVCNYRGRFHEARENFLLAMKKSREENEPNILAKTLHALGNSCFQAKQFPEALNYLHQLQELLQILNKSYMSGTLNLLLGNVYAEMENYELAKKYFKEAFQSLQLKACWNLNGYILLSQGVVAKKMGDFNRASWFFEHAHNTTDQTNFKRLSGLINSEVADLNDSNVDLYLDRQNRIIVERQLGAIDFKHRFVLLEILFLLAQNPGAFYDKDKLAKDIWKDEYNPLIHDKLIYTSVSRLRKLIEPKGEKRKYIIRGKDGYTFNPVVKARFHRNNRPIETSTIGNVEIVSPV